MNHPIQPLALDEYGVLRFQSNAIVRHLLDFGGIDMNKLARMPFTPEDREQFAMLIGYSLSGFGELDYVRSETYESAVRMAEQGETEDRARITYLEGELAAERSARERASALLARIARAYEDGPAQFADAYLRIVREEGK